MRTVSLASQTMYAELVERCLDASFDQQFDERGQFIKVASKGRQYWYFQRYLNGGRQRHYVGPVDDPAISRRVERFKELKADFSERREMVRALSSIFPPPDPLAGSVLEALWKAGFFRLHGVLVGTLAFQCYSGLLGVRLPTAMLQTQDADLSQFKAISESVNDSTPVMIDVLRQADDTFREVPAVEGTAASAYVNDQNYRVEFLTPNLGSDSLSGTSVRMPALGGTAAKPLRFLDYLISEPVWGVYLIKGGIPVRIPAPARFAIHKLILSTRRTGSDKAKTDKDLKQASALIEAMSLRRVFELGEAWTEAAGKGQKWRTALERARSALAPEVQRLLATAIRNFEDEV